MLKFLLLLTAGFAGFAKSEQSNETSHNIQWVKNDFAPFFILDGKYLGQGSGDLFQAYLEQQVDDYHHATVIMPHDKHDEKR